jgi:hypothetical protein
MTIALNVLEAIGRTPLIRLNRASDATGCEIVGTAEFMNPGQSVKDRAALYIIRDAERRGLLRPGGRIVEGTAGNTGIGLAMVGQALGYRTTIVIPRTQSQEKKDAIRLLGAELVEVDAVPYSNPDNYVRYSGRLAEELNKYPLKLGVGREIVQSFRKAREEAFDSAKTARDKRRAFEQYYLGTSAALGAALSRVQDAEMLRPSELYQRRDFIQVCKSFLEEMKEYTERIDRTYREVGAEPNLARGELNAAFARLLGLLKGEQNRSDFHTTLDSLLP